MRISKCGLSLCLLCVSFCLCVPAVHAQVEYGTSAGAVAYIAPFIISDSDLNLWETSASAHAELLDVVADAEAQMNKVSSLSEVIYSTYDSYDSSAWSENTFFWDTFDVTSGSLPNGTGTTVTFVIGLDASLQASSSDSIGALDVVSAMTVEVYTVTLTGGVPADDTLLFSGTAVLDAVDGLEAPDDLTPGDFNVQAISGGYVATLAGYQTNIDVSTTVGSQISLRFSVDTLADAFSGLSDVTAIADLQDSLRLLEVQTEDEVEVSNASGAPIPPVSLGIAPVLVTVLPTIGAVLLARRPRKAHGRRSMTA